MISLGQKIPHRVVCCAQYLFWSRQRVETMSIDDQPFQTSTLTFRIYATCQFLELPEDDSPKKLSSETEEGDSRIVATIMPWTPFLNKVTSFTSFICCGINLPISIMTWPDGFLQSGKVYKVLDILVLCYHYQGLYQISISWEQILLKRCLDSWFSTGIWSKNSRAPLSNGLQSHKVEWSIWSSGKVCLVFYTAHCHLDPSVVL